MLAFLFALVIWLIVPTIMLLTLTLGLWIISSKGISQEIRISAIAGMFAGFMAFVLYVVIELSFKGSTDFNIKYLPSFDLSYSISFLGIGFVVGFCLLWLTSLALSGRLIGIITLLLSATSTSALFSYYFVKDYRDLALYTALGIITGILLHLMFFPKSILSIDLNGRIFGIETTLIVFSLLLFFMMIGFILAIVSLF